MLTPGSLASSAAPLPQPTQHGRLGSAAPDVEYEDLLGLWADLECALAVLLARPHQVCDFPAKVRQLDRWLQELVAHDIDAALYLMFQLASTSTAGYSASHALVCATLCHLMAFEFDLPAHERNALVRAAFTMNISMTALQDELAHQRAKPSTAQRQSIDSHAQRSQALLEKLQITDALWLNVVGQHHQPRPNALASTGKSPLSSLEPDQRLVRMLVSTDRYAAMISPRKTRAGRSATDSVREVVGRAMESRDEAGLLLVRSVGLCPPGTFVRLDNGDTAIVLRRSEQTNLPLVASLLDGTGAHFSEPHLHQTSNGKPRIQAAMARAEVKTELNHRTMVRLGLYAVQRSTPLVTQVGLL